MTGDKLLQDNGAEVCSVTGYDIPKNESVRSAYQELKELVVAYRNNIIRLEGEIERLKNADPDWWYCEIDPDEGGDSPREAMFQHRERLEPVKLHSSYFGPTKWGVIHPSIEDDGEEATTFDTQEEAQKFCDQQKAILAKATVE